MPGNFPGSSFALSRKHDDAIWRDAQCYRVTRIELTHVLRQADHLQAGFARRHESNVDQFAEEGHFFHVGGNTVWPVASGPVAIVRLAGSGSQPKSSCTQPVMEPVISTASAATFVKKVDPRWLQFYDERCSEKIEKVLPVEIHDLAQTGEQSVVVFERLSKPGIISRVAPRHRRPPSIRGP